MTHELIERYIALRDRKAELKRAFDAKTARIDAFMARLEQALAAELTRQGVDRMGGASGVAFFTTVTSATVSDCDAWLAWLNATGNWHLADVRAAKKQVDEYQTEFQMLPPGINWRAARVVRVQRA